VPRWLRLVGFLVVLGGVLLPLRAVAATVPMLFAHDAMSGCTATTGFGGREAVRPDAAKADRPCINDYDAARLMYGATSNLHVFGGASADHAYDAALEHADRRQDRDAVRAHGVSLRLADRTEVGGEGAIYDAPSAATAAEEGEAAAQTLFHYTNEAGHAGILESEALNPSLKALNPADARYGNGQYLSDIVPGTKTPAQLSREFLGMPFHGSRFTHYVEIDVSGLNVVQGRPGVFVIPNEGPLDLAGRIVGSGPVP
jgi:hypothetical protein